MGEIREMMLDGTLCELCGVYLGDAVEFPRFCHHCARDEYDQGEQVRDTLLMGVDGPTFQRVPTHDLNGVKIKWGKDIDIVTDRKVFDHKPRPREDRDE